MGLYITTADAARIWSSSVRRSRSQRFPSCAAIVIPEPAADGAAPLLKPVVARSGDVVELSARGISVNGALLPNTAPLSKDTKGRPLEAWPFGRYVVASGTVWVASSYHPRSFDSRYFGPISTAAIRHRLKAFLTL